MEVNIALLLVAVGLMGLLSLFPVGLRQGTLASSDTAQAAFADQVFNAMRANASTITNIMVWSNASQFAQFVLPPKGSPGSLEMRTTAEDTIAIVGDGNEHSIPDYLADLNYIQYKLVLSGPNGRVWQAWLQSIDRPQTTATNSPLYVTDFVFMGM